ncbi:hypothetical protein [Terrisporobacter petrolearius]|uniref:hypothetical protein n=1 Tax=Terrisporobacter petrolearius TaxID=1460447 RepID=UPI0031CCB1EF
MNIDSLKYGVSNYTFNAMTLLTGKFNSKGANNILEDTIIKNVSNNVTKGTYIE